MSTTVTHRCAVLGSPIAHSLSPVIHRRAYEVLGLTGWAYGAHEVDAAGLASFIETCGQEWVGLSCTMPLKEALLGLGEASELAVALNSANTYLFARDGRPARVENTDVAGIADPLRAVGVERARTAIVVGAGATARSGLAALAQLGVDDVLVIARDAERAHTSLDAVADTLGQTLDVRPWGVPETGRRDVLLSVLPVAPDASLAEALVPLAGAIVDAQYGHGPSRFAGSAAAHSVPLLDGVDMLVAQARVQVRLMTGLDCPAAPLEAAARVALDGR